jgi:hypothetical protein
LLADEKKIHQVRLNGFFPLQAAVFAKDGEWHLQVWISRVERSYSRRLHITGHLMAIVNEKDSTSFT